MTMEVTLNNMSKNDKQNYSFYRSNLLLRSLDTIGLEPTNQNSNKVFET